MVKTDKKPAFTARQVCIIFIFFSSCIKVMLLPSLATFYANSDVYLAVFFILLLDLFVFFIGLYLYKNFSISFYDLLEESFGKPAAKVIIFIYGIYFILKVLPLIFEQKLMCDQVIYETAPAFYVFIPYFILLGYVTSLGFNPLARTFELVLPATAFSIIAIILLSLSAFNPKHLFPVLEFGLAPLAKMFYFLPIWFGDFLSMIFIYSFIKKEKKAVSKLIKSSLFSILVTTSFFILFIGVFGELAVRQTFTVAKISKYNIAFSNLGRLDWVFILIIYFSATLYIIFNMQLALLCFRWAFKVPPIATSVVMVCVFCIILVALKSNFAKILIMYQALSPFVLIMQYGLPIMLFITVILRRKKIKLANALATKSTK